METLQQNWGWITSVLIPVGVAPVVTMAVNKFGSDKAKKRWNAVRKVYRTAFRMSPPK